MQILFLKTLDALGLGFSSSSQSNTLNMAVTKAACYNYLVCVTFPGWQCRCCLCARWSCVEPGHVALFSVTGLRAAARPVKALQQKQNPHFIISCLQRDVHSEVQATPGFVTHIHQPCNDWWFVPWTLQFLQRHHQALWDFAGKAGDETR